MGSASALRGASSYSVPHLLTIWGLIVILNAIQYNDAVHDLEAACRLATLPAQGPSYLGWFTLVLAELLATQGG